MQVVSNEFMKRMESDPYIVRLTLDDADIIQGDPVGAIEFSSGANGDSEGVSIGCAVAASVSITIDRTLSSVYLADRKLKVELGFEINGGAEWLSMGEYTVTDVQENDAMAIVTALDPIAQRLEEEYEDLEGFDFTAPEGVSAKAFITAMCQRRGIPVDLEGLRDIQLRGYEPLGLTERELLGMVAGLYGKFAVIDRDGILRLRWYNTTDREITPDNYYDDGLEKAGYSFRVGWLKCYVEPMEETLTEGNPDAQQGIYFACPWMTEEILAGIWGTVGNFSYTPVAGLSFLGDPRLDPGDMITLKNLSGEAFDVPVMAVSHEYDGGLRTTVTAQGQSKSDLYDGPVRREAKRTAAQILKKQNGIEMSVADVKGEVSTLWLAADEMYTEMEGAQGDISRLKQTVDGFDTRIEDAEGNASQALQTAKGASQTVSSLKGDVSILTQHAGEVSVEVRNAQGESLFSSIVSSSMTVQLVKKDKDGNITSGFYYDADIGKFKIIGAGEFHAAENGGAFVRIENDDFIMYDAGGLEKLRIGFVTGRNPSDTKDVDYPYILLGASTDQGQVGLIKKFWDGMFVGNSYPKNDSGRFEAKDKYAGFFIDTVNGKSYVVQDTVMKNVYTGDAIARFG